MTMRSPASNLELARPRYSTQQLPIMTSVLRSESASLTNLAVSLTLGFSKLTTAFLLGNLSRQQVKEGK